MDDSDGNYEGREAGSTAYGDVAADDPRVACVLLCERHLNTAFYVLSTGHIYSRAALLRMVADRAVQARLKGPG